MPHALPLGLQLITALPDGTRLPLAGEALVEDGVVTIARGGHQGDALRDEVFGILQAHHWEAVQGMPEPGEHVGASQRALRVIWRQGELVLRMDLYDTGYGGETALSLRVARGLDHPQPVPLSFELQLPSGAALPLDAADLRVAPARFCVKAEDAAAETARLVAALQDQGWKDKDGVLVRRKAQLWPEERGGDACLVTPSALSPGWAALGLPARGVVLEELGFQEVRVHGSAGTTGAWVQAADEALRERGWRAEPQAVQTGSAAKYTYLSENGASLTLTPTPDEGVVSLRRTPAPPPPPMATVLLPLPYGGTLRLPHRVTLTPNSPELRLELGNPGSPDDDNPLMAEALTQLLALGWTALEADPTPERTLRRAERDLVLRAGSGFDAETQRSTWQLGISLRADSADLRDLSTAQGGGPGELVVPPIVDMRPALLDPTRMGQVFYVNIVLHVSLSLPGEVVLPVNTRALDVGDGVACARGVAVDETRTAWGELLQAGGWRSSEPGWLARGEDALHLAVDRGSESVCLETRVPLRPWWQAQGLPWGEALITHAADLEVVAIYPSADATRAAGAQILAHLRAQGWDTEAPPRGFEDQGATFAIETVARGDEKLQLTQAISPDSASLTLTRWGPPIPW